MVKTYADRCERYASQRGWHYDPQRLSLDHLTPAQRRRALKKERHAGASARGAHGTATPRLRLGGTC
jgi:hypothetical protein